MKIGVVGCGSWGPNLVRNLMQLNKVDELYCCDLDHKKLERVQSLFPSIKPFRDYKEMLKIPDLDGVVIATPVNSHFPLAKEFLDQGISHLRPMVLKDVAEDIGMHESTISRVTRNKYIHTPQGIFEMKYFFTAGIQTASGDGMSNTSVKDMIADIFKAEDTTKPLSDQEVVKMLKDKGIVIARRTVAKYRTELNILPSNLRKVY
jgi:hypothetical protein